MDDAAQLAPMTDEKLRAEVARLARGKLEGRRAEARRPADDVAAYRAWVDKVVDARWAAPRWPVEWYGRGLSNEQGRIVEREFAARRRAGDGPGPHAALRQHPARARDARAQGQAHRPRSCKGEVAMCLLYSEPGAGSRPRRRAHPGRSAGAISIVVNGQKVWTSAAATADYGMLIARTDWDVPKHQGISFFFLPMKQKGVEVRPLRQITNESHFNEVFFTDAIVPAENLLGELGARLERAADRARLRAVGDGRGAREARAAASPKARARSR